MTVWNDNSQLLKGMDFVT